MGNKLGRRRQVVDEKYTRPQGLYQHNDVDHKKLRKLILDSKLAPCYPGEEECLCDLEECPICFLYYPSLNRSRCCTKRICTECFLRMKTPYATRPTQCPFCKMSNYAVEYRGSKTKEEKGTELIEEQRVIEAKIRMRQQELQDEEERIQKRQETSSSSRIVTPGEAEIEYSPVADEQIISSQYSSTASTIRQPLRRNDEFDLDLEDIMVMEAIWLSIQENGRLRNTSYGDAVVSEQYIQEDCHIPAAVAPLAESPSSSSPSGGLACAIAALAERQQMSGESSSNYSGNTSASRLLHGCSSFSKEEQVTQNYSTPGSSIEVSPANRMEATRDDGEWGVDHVSEMAEMGTSYASSDAAADDAGGSVSLPQQDEIGGCFQTVAGPIVPDSFEEQMMLAMAVSLAEAGARTY